MRHALTVLALLPPALILLHLVVAPYTKVEESFHVQAIHDILVHGFPDEKNLTRSNYDHFEFPGAVPRSAVGAVVIAKLSEHVMLLVEGVNRQILGRIDPDEVELNGRLIWELARAILGMFNAFSIGVLAYALRRCYGQTVAVWYLLLQSSQFHVIYYASRPLSNMFAFGLTTLGIRYYLPDDPPAGPRNAGPQLSLVLLTFAGIVFRSELALFVATQTLALLVYRRARLFQDVIYAGLSSATTGLAATILVDSLFWQQPLWPELDAFLFNVVSGQSSSWGTEPWYFYFLNALPRLLLNPLTYLLAIPVALRQPATRKAAVSLLAPSLGFIALYSIQPHKEWRFIVYTIPALTATAALGAAYLWNRRSRSIFASLGSRLLVLSTLAAFFLSNFVLLPASAANYPGAHALNALHSYHDQALAAAPSKAPSSSDDISVYLGNLACQTGVTRFLQRPDSVGWRYDKTENETTKSTSAFWDRFDYILVEASVDPAFRDSDETRIWAALPKARWETVEIVDGFAGISVLKPGERATGKAEQRLMHKVGGGRLVGLYEHLRDSVRHAALRGWWVELKMEPRIKVLKRIRNGY
ncbi:hypothetical protein N7492_005587 [Penicillium capsulatum]|uniref:Mannosyltransferase n=1 Tax=Penicillium capsulatum TaxID=69766 RepID=A0A9W9I9N2_9EURO|nr:hypothetical protein N7492_005587 [Penicillium capsulatum]KAJ6135314.1 hypothetical protein N7512_000474 [Penicillium capsulatum]